MPIEMFWILPNNVGASIADMGAGCGESFTYCVYPNGPSRQSEIGSDEGLNLGQREYLFTTRDSDR